MQQTQRIVELMATTVTPAPKRMRMIVVTADDLTNHILLLGVYATGEGKSVPSDPVKQREYFRGIGRELRTTYHFRGDELRRLVTDYQRMNGPCAVRDSLTQRIKDSGGGIQAVT